MSPPVQHPHLGRKRRRRRGNYKDLTTGPNPQALDGSVWWNLQSNTAAKAQLAPSPAGFKGAFLLLQEAQEISTQVLSCMLGQEAGPQLGWTIVDKVMRRGPEEEVCLPLCSHDGIQLPVQTINSLFPKSASCWVELQSGSTVFLRPDKTVPSGVSLVF